MKISHDFKANTETGYSRPAAAPGAQAFQRTLQSQAQQLKQQEIETLMKNITLQGDKLSRYRTFRELAVFKRMVRGFLQEMTAGGYTLKKSRHFGWNSRGQELTLLEAVDEKLIELTEEVMNQERKTVNILSLIGEIKGLLINIYT
ncbi:YaaR family protein [Virgibacillus sediminis]|uniref:YaaR family protein n=1 Tax=Virgibacillus sediminis TaxID=202260 RepID=A0ABV7A6Z8_9BACI